MLVIDVTSDDSVKQAAATLATKISALDVLINNAGILAGGTKGPFEETIQETKDTFEVNVFGVIRTTNAFVELVKKSKHGRIVNVSSILASIAIAKDPTNPFSKVNTTSYNASKTAINHITVIYAKALEEFGIKVNAADPGYTATDITGTESNQNVDASFYEDTLPGGPQTVEVGAQSTVFLATLPDDGPTASFYNKDGVLPW